MGICARRTCVNRTEALPKNISTIKNRYWNLWQLLIITLLTIENHNGEVFFAIFALPHAVVRMLPSRKLIGCGSLAAALGGNLWSGSGVAGV